MLTSKKCYDKFGAPGGKTEGRYMSIWNVPAEIKEKIPALPNRIYCANVLKKPLENALKALIDKGIASELKTWDGCYTVRKSRGLQSMSLHSWGVAVDVNAATNGLGKTPTLSKEFVSCFTENGFDWGGTWKRKDGMHFQLKSLND